MNRGEDRFNGKGWIEEKYTILEAKLLDPSNPRRHTYMPLLQSLGVERDSAFGEAGGIGGVEMDALLSPLIGNVNQLQPFWKKCAIMYQNRKQADPEAP